MSSIDFHIKARDAYQMLADAHNEEIERRRPPEVEYGEQDFNKLFWEDREGAKGPFQRTSKRANNNSPIFQALQAILKEHNGFCIIGDYKLWFDNQNPDVIDRRRK